MADIFNEIDEDLRRERAKKIWEKYGSLIIAAAVVVVLVVAAWRAYEFYQQQQAEAAGDRFQEALTLSRSGKGGEAEGAFTSLMADAPSGYRTLARFRLAAEAAARDKAKGVEAYDALAADATAGPLLQGAARIRAAYLMVDTAAYQDLAARIEPLAQAGEPWRNSAREILGLSAWKAKDLAAAGKWFELIVADQEVTAPMRQRADLMLQLIAADAPPKAAS
jgi:hypothetical protein